jgi:hypothetical protein
MPRLLAQGGVRIAKRIKRLDAWHILRSLLFAARAEKFVRG